MRKYKQEELDGFKESRTWKRYSPELKGQAVRDYLDGRSSLTASESLRKKSLKGLKIVEEKDLKANLI
ncbi:hypothetical protein SORDD16_00072 [Streptococcus oralis]|uniref:Transposase n=1 Tax=Streptococcus oralis TaxID=1303 RepID=A0A139PG55_STROR|nr:hypothetical protein SORDD16_00072 [Streptococcus oralis]